MSIYEKLGAKTAGIKARTIDKPVDKQPRTAPGMLLSATQRIDAAEARVEELEAKLKDAEDAGSREIPLDQLHEVPGRRRKLTAQQYQELKDNLRHNLLVTPITVRPRTQGGYEIVSGNNRVAVFQELGRTAIPAAILNSDDDQAEINAFYANLLHPDLPDFEKYLGFKSIISKHSDLTHAQIADGAGVSRSFVSQLLAFDDLPTEAKAILMDMPHVLGANAAQDMAALVRKGRSHQVVVAISKLAAGEVDQSRAVKDASTDAAPKSMASKPAPIQIKSGRATYCAIQRADKVLRIQFQSAEEAEAVQSAVREVLERRAKELK